MSLWLKGGAGFVQVVLLFKWTKTNDNQVKAFVELYDLDSTGDERLLQSQVINSLAFFRLKHKS